MPSSSAPMTFPSARQSECKTLLTKTARELVIDVLQRLEASQLETEALATGTSSQIPVLLVPTGPAMGSAPTTSIPRLRESRIVQRLADSADKKD